MTHFDDQSFTYIMAMLVGASPAVGGRVAATLPTTGGQH